MRRKAAIDVGTNSVRLLVAEISDSIKPLYKAVKTTRLGKGVDSKGVLSKEAVDRTLKAIEMFTDISVDMEADQIIAIATSAVRDASNAQYFIQSVKELGIDIRVIEGDEEAKLGYLGAVLGAGVEKGKIVLVDIGGGSTELVEGRGNSIDFMTSIDIGAVRLTERFIKNDPITPGELDNIFEHVKGQLSRAYGIVDKHQGINVVGIGGTITSLAAITQGLTEYDRDLVHRFVLTRGGVEYTVDHLSRMSLEERRKVPGLQPERADIIVAGAVILLSLLDYIGQDRITVSEWDNLEGLIYQKFFIADKITG